MPLLWTVAGFRRRSRPVRVNWIRKIATSVRHTYWLMGDTTRALEAGGRFYFEAMVPGRDRPDG